MIENRLAILCNSQEEIIMAEMALKILGVNVMDGYLMGEIPGKVIGFCFNFSNRTCRRFQENSLFDKAIKRNIIMTSSTLGNFIEEINNG